MFNQTPPWRAWPVALLFLAGLALAADNAPLLGAKDFYPSPERPAGYRGDGNGWFPGATPVSEWWDGTPVEKSIQTGDPAKPKVVKYWDFADGTSKNVVWKTEMPAWANTQPIVVGDRVICYGEPDMVICTDANTGKVLWTTAVNPWVAAGVDPAKAETARKLADIYDAICRVNELQFHFGTCGRYLSEEQLKPLLQTFMDKEWPGIKARLAELDPAAKWDGPCKLFEDQINGAIATYVDGKAGWDYGKKCKILGFINGRAQAITGKKMQLESPWGNMVGFNMSAPVSDGAFVYVQMGQGQTACLDLKGKIIWQTWFEGNASTHHVLSPLLADGVLVDMHGSGTLRGLDAKTGKVAWEAPTSKPTKSTRGGYYVASHAIMRLDGVAYIVTSQCAIIRAKDGKHVGEFDFGEAYGGGCPIAAQGDLILKCANGDGWSQPFKAFRLKADGPDKVTAEKVWELKSSGGYESRIVTPDAVWAFTRDGAAVDPATGAVLNRAPIGGAYRIMAGNLLIWCDGGSGNGLGSNWSSRRADGKALMPFGVADVTNPKAPKILSTKNVIGGTDDPRLPGTEALLPNLWKEPQFFNAKGGKPAHCVNTDTCMFASGNRLFIRTATHLYCIGDPAVAYDWDAKTRPEAVTKGLED